MKKGDLVAFGSGVKARFGIPSNTIAGKIWNRSLKNRKASPRSRKLSPKSGVQTPHRPMTSVKKIAFKICKRASLTAKRLKF